MKLLYIVKEINGTTGLERILAIKTNYFIETYNYDVTIVTLNKEVDKPFFEFNDKIKFINLPQKGLNILSRFSQFRKINKILNQVKPNIVLITITDIFGLYLPLFLKNKFIYVYERHNSKRINLEQGLKSKLNSFTTILKNKLLDRAGKHYDKVVLLSDDHREEWKYLSNLTIINNPLIFYPNDYAKLDNKSVLAVGRHAHQKGFDMLMKSWAKVVNKHKDWTLDVYGEKDNNLSYISIAEKYGITNYVNFHDPVQNIMEVYMESSIYALSSRYEGFPLVLIETMACGVPPVAFNCPFGVEKLINHKQDGLKIEVNNTDDFAESLMYLMENPKIRKEMGMKARKNILRLSPEKIFPKWKNLFEELMSR